MYVCFTYNSAAALRTEAPTHTYRDLLIDRTQVFFERMYVCFTCNSAAATRVEAPIPFAESRSSSCATCVKTK